MKSQIDAAIEVLKKGGVILYPTDTVWGLGCDATNEEAVEKICATKVCAIVTFSLIYILIQLPH